MKPHKGKRILMRTFTKPLPVKHWLVTMEKLSCTILRQLAAEVAVFTLDCGQFRGPRVILEVRINTRGEIASAMGLNLRPGFQSSLPTEFQSTSRNVDR
jgi:hypothetical protein